ncbi:MAG: aldehyde ferredoxin oxidoreductase family protein [Candidatus Jordarchaeum sp.]|uniref:aldehyde ferredoxin oxidoreductase family protein n=1 Tax=Candidatus Jordarchaeum sp. TaxID=2823881 RepID=UPI004049D738
MISGFMGKILRIDLSKGEVKDEPINEEWAKLYLGARGYLGRLLYNELKLPMDAFSPENILAWMTGPCAGTLTAGSGKYDVCAVSPLSGGWGDSSCGGFFAWALKRTGYDGVVIKGKSEKPVYLYLSEAGGELKDASHLWGKNTFETEDIIKKDLGEKTARVSTIGPAGEKLIRYASIECDHGSFAGRMGLGAVAGSKNFKAIAAVGQKKIPAANPEELKKTYEAYLLEYQESIPLNLVAVHGTAGFVGTLNELAVMPVKNFQLGYLPEADDIDGPTLTATIGYSPYACFGCPVTHDRKCRVETPKYAFDGHGPEYEALALLGSNTLNHDLEALSYAAHLCDLYGVDCISIGNSIGWAIESFEKGVITEKDTGGLKLEWGNPDLIIEMIKKIANREKGIWHLLGEGVKRAAEKIGQGSEAWAVQVKGVEMSAWDPRGVKMMGINMATTAGGARHTPAITLFEVNIPMEEFGMEDPIPGLVEEGKSQALKDMQDYSMAVNAAGQCIFTAVVKPSMTVEFVNHVTGMNLNWKDLLKIGERIINLQRAFNFRCGFTIEDDTLPKRILFEPKPDGYAKGVIYENFEGLLEEHYDLRGWDKKTGKPTKERLQELGLDDIAKDMWD